MAKRTLKIVYLANSPNYAWNGKATFQCCKKTFGGLFLKAAGIS